MTKYIVVSGGFKYEFKSKLDAIKFIRGLIKYAKVDRDSITIWDSDGNEVLKDIER